jgi:hypothetical protein
VTATVASAEVIVKSPLTAISTELIVVAVVPKR